MIRNIKNKISCSVMWKNGFSIPCLRLGPQTSHLVKTTIWKQFSSNILRNTRQQLRNYANQHANVENTINNVTLLGRVGNEPQTRGPEENPVVIFSVATHNNYKYENGDWEQRTEWHRISVFKPALRDSVLNYLKKGQRTMITGKISYSEVTDQDGKARLSTSIIAHDIVFFHSY